MEKRQKKTESWLDFFTDVVTANPKLSALIAFELGRIAGRTTLEATDKYKTLKPRLSEARDYLMAHLPNLPGAAQLGSLNLLHGPDLASKHEPRKISRAATRKKPRKKAKPVPRISQSS